MERCLAHAREDLWRGCHWTAELLALMVETPDERLTPTRLLQCPRQVALKRRYEYTLDPKVEWRKVRGVLMHRGLEALSDGEREVTVARTFETYTITGRLDRIEGALIVDWKTRHYTPRDFCPPDEHVLQLSLYGWLLEPRLGAMPSYGELVYLDMREVRRFVVHLRPVAEIEAWLRERIPALLQAYDATTPLAAPYTPEHPEYFRCKQCPVQEICHHLAEKEETG